MSKKSKVFSLYIIDYLEEGKEKTLLNNFSKQNECMLDYFRKAIQYCLLDNWQ